MFDRILRAVVIGIFCLAGNSWGQTPVKTPVVNTDTNNGVKVYMLSPNDVIQMKVYQEDDLETTARIAADGNVTLPLLGPVKIGGKSVKDASKMIQDLFAKDFLVNPQVNLIIREYAKRHFTILGQVQKPNTYDFPNEESVSLSQAIGMGGGYTRIGAPSKITVQRLENGQNKSYKLDADALEKQGKTFEILPDDIITVGEKWI